MTTMSVRTFMQVAQRLPANASVLLRGNHGIGKSALVRQLAMLLGFAQKDVIDRRLSQVSEGDIIGLPSTDGNVTRFNPPDWFKQACDEPKVLFLDELNRATPEVMQAAFQIVLDRELNGWKLHPKTRVFSAVNSSANYNVNEIDPALLDRFWTIDLSPDTKDWLAWAKKGTNELGGDVIDTIVDFISHHDKWLDTPKNVDMGAVSTSRRSWERLSNALRSATLHEDPNHELFYPMCLGFVGTEATIAFCDFAKSIDNRVTGEEIVNHYNKVEAKINRMQQEKLNMALEKAAEYVVTLDKVTDKQGANIKKFMTKLPGELRISFWTQMTKSGVDKLELAKSIHKHCAEQILEVFGVPMGEAGIGVVPNVPGMFQNQNKDKASK